MPEINRTRTPAHAAPDLLVTVLDDGRLEVRTATIENGVPVSYHRYILEPEASVETEPSGVQLAAAAAWTTPVVNRFRTAETARRNAEL